jgi:DNA-binding response OmpR family regulator
MVSIRGRTIRVGVVCSDHLIGDDWVRVLRTQRIIAFQIPLLALDSATAKDLEICIIHEPELRWRELLTSADYNREIGTVIATASVDPRLRAGWLDAGADDCVPYPVDPIELGARIRAISRRLATHLPPRAVLAVGRLTLNGLQRCAYLDGKPLELTSNEFELLATLARVPGRVFSRERLLELTKGSADEAFDRSIDVLVSRLRAKLGDDPRDPTLLRTVRGRGYVLACP